jgi:hypothetical protein
MMRGKALLLAVTFMTFMLSATTTNAKFARSDAPVPVDRLIKNVTEYIKANPDDANGYYTLGRVHSLAYAADGNEIDVVGGKDGLPKFAPYQSITDAGREPKSKLTDAAREHLRKAIENYGRATEMDPKIALHWFGYGWVLAQAHYQQLAPTSQPTNLGKAPTWRKDALKAYQTAFDLAARNDLKGEGGLRAGDAFVAHQVTLYAPRLLEEEPDSPDKAYWLKKYQNFKDEFDKKPMAVTPIVFPLDRDRPLASLVDNDRTVTFQLAGYDDGRRWPWVKADTAILVWDPSHTGKIESGRQLFGSVTWWLFWQNGYEPLAMLDDNRDGSLAGSELAGLAVWVDRNADGVSDAGEVTPIESAGVERLLVRHQTRDGVLQSRSGVIFRDGRSVSSYDWMPVSKD